MSGMLGNIVNPAGRASTDHMGIGGTGAPANGMTTAQVSAQRAASLGPGIQQRNDELMAYKQGRGPKPAWLRDGTVMRSARAGQRQPQIGPPPPGALPPGAMSGVIGMTPMPAPATGTSIAGVGPGGVQYPGFTPQITGNGVDYLTAPTSPPTPTTGYPAPSTQPVQPKAGAPKPVVSPGQRPPSNLVRR